MARCQYCRDEGARFRCNWCGQTVCGQHRLPENHGCDGSQYQVSDDQEAAVEPIDRDAIGRTGGRPTGDFGESSPDVRPDGSIVRDDKDDEDDEQERSLVDRLLFWR
jgi:hypothetical protein